MLCPACSHDNLPGDDLCRDCGMDLAGLDVAAWGLDPQDPVLATPLSDLPLKEPPVLPSSSTVSDAIGLMKQRGEGCVFVSDNRGTLSGILTEHDVAARVAARGRDPARTRLEDVMSPDPVRLQSGDPLVWALHRMGVDGYRHLPVVEGERLVGFLSVRNVLQVLREV